MNLAIKIDNLSKRYEIYNKPSDRLKQLLFPKKQFYKEFCALSEVSFQINKGEVFGIIGKNGSGKSTLLQIISGTLSQTSGNIDKLGRVAALLELGAGFNPEFSGKENIYLYASILGLSEDEIKESYNDIVEFSELGDFIDQPVKNYSSGMYVRLAFSVAVNVNPDILIVDEALSVGDIRFQKKCIDKMNEFKKKGVTILFVSHSMEQVKRFCNRCVWLNAGSVVSIGDATQICDEYINAMNDEIQPKEIEKETVVNTEANQLGSILEVKLENNHFKTFDKLAVSVKYKVVKEDKGLLLGVAIRDHERKYIFGPNTFLENKSISFTKGDHDIKFVINKLPLLAGKYHVDVGLFSDKGLVNWDYKQEVGTFIVTSDYFSEGIVYINHEWQQ